MDINMITSINEHFVFTNDDKRVKNSPELTFDILADCTELIHTYAAYNAF